MQNILVLLGAYNFFLPTLWPNYLYNVFCSSGRVLLLAVASVAKKLKIIIAALFFGSPCILRLNLAKLKRGHRCKCPQKKKHSFLTTIAQSICTEKLRIVEARVKFENIYINLIEGVPLPSIFPHKRRHIYVINLLYDNVYTSYDSKTTPKFWQ